MWHVLGEEERVREVSVVSERVWEWARHHRCHHHQHHCLHHHHPLHQHGVGSNGEVTKCWQKRLLSRKWNYRLIRIHVKLRFTFQPILHSHFSVTESHKCNCKQSNMRRKFQVAPSSNLIPGVEISFTHTLSATTVSDWKPGQPQLKRVSQVQVQVQEQKYEVTKSSLHVQCNDSSQVNLST